MTTAKAKPPGRWTKGQSGNPEGRKPGTGKVAELRASIAEHLPDIIAKLIEQAKAGDAGAARLLIERVIPPVKAMEQPVHMDLSATATPAEQGRAVLAAAGAGDMAPGQAAQLLAGLGALAKLIEVEELSARVAALEGRHVKS